MIGEEDRRLLDTVREHCNQTNFDWPSNDPSRTGPLERTLYQEASAVRDAPWERSELLRILKEEESRAAELERVLGDALNTLIALDGPSEQRSEFERRLLDDTKLEIRQLISSTFCDRKARHEPLLKRLTGVPGESVDTFLTCPREELEARAMVQMDWLAYYARSLDDLELKDGKDGARLPDDIRRAVGALIGKRGQSA